jgi:hypothetical protein
MGRRSGEAPAVQITGEPRSYQMLRPEFSNSDRRRGVGCSNGDLTPMPYSALPGSWPEQSPTRRIMVRIEDEYFGADSISVSMVP